MKVSYVEGVANHNGPESCGAAREGGVEALKGDVQVGEGNTGYTAIARCTRIPRGPRPRAYTQAP
jgi:hypothetical protein